MVEKRNKFLKELAQSLLCFMMNKPWPWTLLCFACEPKCFLWFVVLNYAFQYLLYKRNKEQKRWTKKLASFVIRLVLSTIKWTTRSLEFHSWTRHSKDNHVIEKIHSQTNHWAGDAETDGSEPGDETKPRDESGLSFQCLTFMHSVTRPKLSRWQIAVKIKNTFPVQLTTIRSAYTPCAGWSI